jgi:hypothetical protein
MKIVLWGLCIGLVMTLARAAETPDRGTPLPPQVEFRPLNASRLRLGMEAAEVVRIMGNAPRSDASADSEAEALYYAAEPIPTRVVLTGRRVSSISLDIARLDDVRLPAFTRTALLGMSSQGVRDMLGVPTDTRHHEYFGIKLDELIFERGLDPAVSVFFVGDHVVNKALGPAVPEDIFRLILPTRPDTAPRTAEDAAVIGASANDLEAMLGKPILQVIYGINGQPAAHALYETRDHHTLSVYFLGDVATEITDVGIWSIDAAPSG